MALRLYLTGRVCVEAGETLASAVLETPWHRNQPARARYEALFSQIGEGLNFLCLHANAPGEIEVIEPNSAQIRIDEFDLLPDPDFMAFVEGLSIRRGSLRDFRA